MSNLTLLRLLLVCFMLGACQAQAPTNNSQLEIQSPLATAVANNTCDTTTWIRINNANVFFFSLPADMRKVEVQAIDSYAEQYQRDKMVLTFDYGWYANPLTSQSNTKQAEYTESTVEISGKSARMVFFKDQTIGNEHPYFAGVHFADLVDKKTSDVNGLTIEVWFADKEEYQVVKCIFTSVTFE